MFKCKYEDLTVSFNEFYEITPKTMPEYGEFCLIELKDGRLTGGEWNPKYYEGKDKTTGSFIRGTADSISSEEVARWHSLWRYDLSNCLEREDLDYINNGMPGDDIYSVQLSGFKSFDDGDFPEEEQYCLLIMNDGGMAAGRWNRYGEDAGAFIYAPALASHSMKKVWAWTPLSSDEIFEREQEAERERRLEEELNKNPSADPEKFKYGTDIDVYYEKALQKLIKKYPWATVTQMKKGMPWEILPSHGQYVFAQDEGKIGDIRVLHEWKDGSTADEFIDFLCEYTKDCVENSNPDAKFKYGMDIKVYLDKAFAEVKKTCHWIDRKTLNKRIRFDIRQINGDWEFVCDYNRSGDFFICEYGTAELFIGHVADEYEKIAIETNPVVDTYDVPFKHVEIHGWNLERYRFVKMGSGDYKVDVQAGDRVTGGSRTFFITPDCFEAKTYEEFLDRYLKIVPGRSFGLEKEDLLPDENLKKFLGY